MERRFPLIKSTANLPLTGLNFLKSSREPLPNQSPTRVTKLKSSSRYAILHNSSRNIQSVSRLPPILTSNPPPSFTPIISDPFAKNQTSRRSVSNTVLPFNNKNVLIKCSFLTKIGEIMGIPKPQNQDAYIIRTSLSSMTSSHFAAVCDGHGTEGHLVSSLLKSSTPSILEKKLSRYPATEALRQTIDELSTKVLNTRIDTNFSGSTFIGVLIQGDILYCCNVGDSRAVVGSNLNKWASFELSKDQKPSRKDEAARIIEKGGRIATHDQGGPLRIWYLDQDLPGLAMTRSIGDKASRVIGLISEPEIIERKLTPSDKFIIIASDGVWEFISSQESVEIVGATWAQGKPELACEKLVKESSLRWKRNSAIVDDITVVILFLDVR